MMIINIICSGAGVTEVCDMFVSCFRLERCVRDVAGCGARRAWILLLDTTAEELQRTEDSPQHT